MTIQQIKDAAERVDTLQKNLHEAEELIASIQQWPRRISTVGAMVVITDGVDEYASEAFDEALGAVVKEHFPELAREALGRMAQAYHSALIAEKEHLKGALKEVERAEAAAAQANPHSDVNRTGINPEPSHA